MKKLLITSAVIMMACMTQAASFTWGFSSDEIVGPTDAYNDEGYISGGTAMLFLGVVTASESAFDYSSATFITSGGQNASFMFGSPSTTVSSDYVASTAAGQAYTLVLLADSGVTSLDGYEGYYILSTGTSGQGVNPMDDTDTWATFVDRTAYGQASWSTMSAVPEPTSGLLLLLGMAGLALKRKRA